MRGCSRESSRVHATWVVFQNKFLGFPRWVSGSPARHFWKMVVKACRTLATKFSRKAEGCKVLGHPIWVPLDGDRFPERVSVVSL